MKENDYIVVTGAAGFIGTNLCIELVSKGNNVICIDNLSSGTQRNINIIKECANNCDVIFIYKDVVDKDVLNIAEPDMNITAIYHLACPASPIFYQKTPLNTIATCYQGTLNMCEAAIKWKCPILLTSTSEVYGDPNITPQSETYRGNTNCFGPRACYDEGKRIAETIMYEYSRGYGDKFKVVRIFNTYGPYMRPDDGRFISNFICQNLKDKPMTIYGDGNQTRSICYVDDTVNGLIAMMNSNQIGPINIGNPIEKSVKDWADLIADCTKNRAFYIYKKLPVDDPMQRCPDIDRAKQFLNWQPVVSPEDGLRKTISYFKNRLNYE